jgi:hypothetical protein
VENIPSYAMCVYSICGGMSDIEKYFFFFVPVDLWEPLLLP